MRKTTVFILSLLSLGWVALSCDQSQSMQEYIREEKKSIERYIQSQKIDVLDEYPKDSTFKDNQYYKTSDGLYMHVVDKGNPARRAETYDEVLVRFDYFVYIKSYVSGQTDSIVLNYNYLPIAFTYGIPGSYYNDPAGLACNGFSIPLSYVGEGGVVDLIIPSELGNSTDNSSFAPVFYKNLKYTKFR
ncbi:MAG: DUF4827 domain-containing protein [Dysgonamonadaceae bacterium]|jgi:hypothetical protein|nr:DUF4827 domain-containing protein [Dysgonamonadaceae bacterium]